METLRSRLSADAGVRASVNSKGQGDHFNRHVMVDGQPPVIHQTTEYVGSGFVDGGFGHPTPVVGWLGLYQKYPWLYKSLSNARVRVNR